jgi:collagenase-like PrtC family protease
MKLTLGPILFNWQRDEILDFYKQAQGWPVDRVYLGEVVCANRVSHEAGLSTEDILGIADRLKDTGKEVVVTSLAIVSNEKELELTRSMASLPFAIEANDASVFGITGKATSNAAKETRKKVFAGAHIKSYNNDALDFLNSIGIRHVTLPVELPKETIRALAEHAQKLEMGLEVFAHGKLPLAFSWRCYTLLNLGLTKKDCTRQCLENPSGIDLKTMDNEECFTINGTSILSNKPLSLIEHIDELREMGIAALRISPKLKGTGQILNIFKERIDNKMGPAEAIKKLTSLRQNTKTEFVNGFYTGTAGKNYINP